MMAASTCQSPVWAKKDRADRRHECCTFRGSVSALDANTGAVIWKTYTMDEPKPRGKNKDGVQLWGPAGPGSGRLRQLMHNAAQSTSRRATYAEPNSKTSDAVVAFDMASGKILWTFQPTQDVWVGGCKRGDENPNCPNDLGPDHDFSMSPVLPSAATDQTSSSCSRSPAWHTRSTRTSREHSCGRIARATAPAWVVSGAPLPTAARYFSVNGPAKLAGGMRAVNVDTGAVVWSKDAEARLCGTERGCSQAQGAAVTAIPGIVFSVSMDGGIRAHAADDGTTVWSFNTNQEFQTVNGVKAKGGAIDGRASSSRAEWSTSTRDM